jgi:ribosomal protein S18 acetylase RimI-like enzyme
MSQVTVERVEPTTLAEVSEFLRREWEAFDREFFGTSADQWAKKQHLLRAVVDGQTVGVADFYVLGGVAHLSEIMVAQAWRDRGIGVQLMARFEKVARAAGCHKLSLRVAEDSPAVRFYRRLGYEVEGKMVNHFYDFTFLQLCKFLGAKGPE